MSAPAAGTGAIQSILLRLRLSPWGVFSGLLLFLAGLILVYGAEKDALQFQKGSWATRAEIVPVPSLQVLDENEGKLVHVFGRLETDSVLKDRDFGLSVRTVKLRRKVEMLQWKETLDPVKAPLYEAVWSDSVVDSSGYADQELHQNPDSIPVKEALFRAQNVKLGEFWVSRPLLDQFNEFTSFSTDRAERFPVRMDRRFKPFRGGYFLGSSPAAPRVGDVRVWFEISSDHPVTIVARQSGGTLIPYESESGQWTALLFPGKKSPEEMVEKKAPPKNYRTPVFRVLGIFCFFLAGILCFAAATTLGQRWKPFRSVTAKGIFWFALLLCLILYPASAMWVRWHWIYFSILCAVLSGAWLFFRNTAEPREEGEEAWEAGGSLTSRDWMIKGGRLFKAGNLKGSLDAFSTAVYMDDQLAGAFFNRSVVHRKIGNKKEALLDIKKAAELGHPKAKQTLDALKAHKKRLQTKKNKPNKPSG